MRCDLASEILDALPGAVLTLDDEGVVRDVNAKALAMLERPLEGCTWSTVVNRAFSRRETVDGDLLLRTGRWVRLSRKTLASEAGEILVLTDISDSRQMTDLIQRNERLSCIGEMAAKLAHQLRTPVASALLYARQIKDEASALSEPAERICDRLSEIAQMINEMLCFAGGTRGGDDRFTVGELYDEILDTSREHVDVGRLEVALAEPGILVAGNRVAIKGALLNLIENAVQACDASGRVELGAERIRDRVCLTVSDNGHGIPREIRDRLFDPFFTTRPQGTGLGLAVVKAVAEAHGGDVMLDSSGSGTTVALCLPRCGGES